MGLITLCKGDIFAGKPMALAHGCNLKGVMGAGIAVRFKELFPEMFERYRKACKSNEFKLGDIYAYEGILNDNKVRVYNLMTQEAFNGATIQALRTALFNMCNDADSNGICDICMPLIGSGLGRITPTTVLNILFEVAIHFKVNLNVVVCFVEGELPKMIFETREAK